MGAAGNCSAGAGDCAAAERYGAGHRASEQYVPTKGGKKKKNMAVLLEGGIHSGCPGHGPQAGAVEALCGKRLPGGADDVVPGGKVCPAAGLRGSRSIPYSGHLGPLLKRVFTNDEFHVITHQW